MSRNGQNNKGGRPKGSKSNHTLEAERAKAYIVEQYIANIAPMIAAQIKKASKGDTYAFKEISERALGKVTDKVVIQEVKKLLSFDD